MDSLDAWNIAYDELEFGPKVAAGEFGAVYAGRFYGAKVAIKHIKAVKDGSPLIKYITRELSIQSVVAHPNVVQFLGMAKSEDGEVYVVSEWAGRGDLRRYLYGETDSCGHLVSWEQKVLFMLDIAQAASYLHARGVVHRDLKSENCLLTGNLIVKVCDFGLSRQMDEEQNLKMSAANVTPKGKTRVKLADTSAAARLSMAGTDEWMAPEVTLGQPYGLAVDVFSLGIVFWEISLCKRPPARLPQEYFEFPKEEFLAKLPKDAPAGLAELTIDCCLLEPEKRPVMAKVVERLKGIVDALGPKTPPVVNSPKTARGFSPPTSPRRAIPAVQAKSSIPDLNLSK